MNLNISQILEEELVMAKATSRPEDSVFLINEKGQFCNANSDVYINFCDTNFLGINTQKYDEIYSTKKVFNTFSSGVLAQQKFFEKQLIDFLHVKDTAIFPSYNGISADILENILNTEDAIIYDENINPALIRGVRICKADKIRYHHNDMDKLEEALKMTQMRRLRIIVTDGIFYDLGDCANLSAIKKLAEHYNALVLLDDSFGFLTCGKNGHGSDELCGVKNFADIKLINMQNSLCLSNGAIVCGDSIIIELLKRRSKVLKFSNSLSERDFALASDIISQISINNLPIEILHQKTNRLCEILKQMNFEPKTPCAGIVSFTSEKSIDSLKRVFKEKKWICEYIKRGNLTLVSLKVSAISTF
ncbi:MAG: aminotransferase class I/II-fold pyridoxal phosphate-dependent enzyme [Bacteroidales bacterium]|nr:aminotransferase class I/II-fold pyridoxal phosphate-dependent enzyme [Bacteroidales bacterium]